MTSLRAEVLAIGDELLHGSAIDTNSAWLSQQLEALGVHVVRFTVVGDEPGSFEAALRGASTRVDLVVSTGGLGPTEDDRTRHEAAAVAGVELVFDPASWDAIGEWCAVRGRQRSDDNRRQALVPVGGTPVRNDFGTAPGLAMDLGACRFYALPGVPSEMRGMFGAMVLPDLRDRFAGRLRPVVHRTLNVLGPTEAALGARLADLMADLGGDVRVGVTAHFGLLRVRIAAHAEVLADAEALADRVVAQVRPRLGEELIYEGDQDIAARLVEELRAGGWTVATAESCTGGLVARALTDQPGSSAVFPGGLVCYSNESKVRDLGVAPEDLEREGAVSASVARQLARGVADRFDATFGVGITGIAGPDGGSDAKPVGTVWFGLHRVGHETVVWERRIAPVSRSFVRERAAFEALASILRTLRADRR
ncbi:MAG: competence/damage-inducible protein A [Planctomycetota bacterium]